MSEPFLQPDSELIIGLVGPVGASLDEVEPILRDRLREHFQYDAMGIRLSDLIREIDGLSTQLYEDPPAARYNSYMDAGNEARIRCQRGDFLALSAAYQIQARREREDGNRTKPKERTAYVLRSLKHPEEAQTLRRIYGAGFFLIGIHAPRDLRKRFLVEDKNVAEADAEALLDRDEAEAQQLGQRTRDTFELCDAFVSLQDGHHKRQLWRLLDLLFGRPDLTPTRDEHAMFMAYAASLRSCDLSRQVGAVITSEAGELIADGANDVPKFGGGLYTSDDGQDDKRDWVRGYDSNEKERNRIAARVVRALKDIPDQDDLAVVNANLEELSKTGLLDLTEFGRPVHAEMEALMACARSGVTPRGGTLYSTTFPCHNCAKHVVAAGIERVVYVEPYPKSKALQLHEDSITLQRGRDKVRFEPFVGVGPRRFVDLFSMRLSSGRPIRRKARDQDGKRIEWNRSGAQPRVPMATLSYLEREQAATALLDRLTEEGS